MTRKITRSVARIETGLEETLYLGNLEAKRDWGHARDYVEGMHRILQADEPDDFVLATGETRSVREFVELAFAEVGRSIEWRGKGVDETGIDKKSGKTVVRDRSGVFPPDRGRCVDRRRQPRRARSSAGSRRRRSPNSSRRWWRAIWRSRGGRSPMARIPFELKGKTVFVAGHGGMVGGALVRRLARENVELLTVGRQRSRFARSGRGVRLVCRQASAGGVSGGGQGRRHRRQQHAARRIHLRQSGHRGQCDPRRARQWRGEADVSRLVLHLSQAGAAAAARGFHADRTAGADQRALCDRQDRRHQDGRGLSQPVSDPTSST